MTTVIIPAVTGDDQHVTVPIESANPIGNPGDDSSSCNVTGSTMAAESMAGGSLAVQTWFLAMRIFLHGPHPAQPHKPSE